MFVLTIVIFLAILIIGHELGHFLTARKFGVRIDEFGFGLPPRIASRKKGETRFSLNLLPLGGFVKIHGQHREEGGIEDPERAFVNQPASRRAVILISGVLANLLIGWAALSLVFFLGTPAKLFITEVLPESAAAEAGLKANEAVEGYSSPEEFKEFIESHRGQSVTINDRVILVPQAGAIGVVLSPFSIPKQGPFASVIRGLEATASIAVGVVKAVFQVVSQSLQGDPAGLNQVAGPVGIFNIIKQADGAAFLIYLLGAISINLAIFNLLPVPALDGGHLLFLGVEKIIGRPLPRRAETAANAIGFALLILLIIVVTFKDIGRL